MAEDSEPVGANAADSAGEEAQTETPLHPFRTWLRRIMAVLVLLGFLLLSFSDGLRILTSPPLDFLAVSRELIQDPFVRELQKPVVQVRSSGFGFDQVTRQGTGFNIDEHGLVVTNRHLVEGARMISVHFRDHGVFYATEWIEHPHSDLAVIRLNGNGLPTASIRLDGLPPVGSDVLVIGNPLGFV